MKRTLIIAGVVVVLLAGGALTYRQYQLRRAAPVVGDPAFAVAFALRTLDRSEGHRLTTEQIKTILPMLKVLRDTGPNDIEASRALAAQIRAVLTPEQVAYVEKTREEFQRRGASGQPGNPQASPAPGQGPGGSPEFGPGPGQGGGPGGGGRPRNRAEFRKRLLDLLIRRLELEVQ